MGRKIVGQLVFSASSMRENMIGRKLALRNLAATEMAAGIRLVEYGCPLLTG
jgi:hypothetical protein